MSDYDVLASAGEHPAGSRCGFGIVSQLAVSGGGSLHLTQSARALAAQYNLSLRTAYRHLARGTTPSADRCIGRDGKTYPAHLRGGRPHCSAVARELVLMRQALNRADQRACEVGGEPTDVDTLRHLLATANEILERWRGLFPKEHENERNNMSLSVAGQDALAKEERTSDAVTV